MEEESWICSGQCMNENEKQKYSDRVRMQMQSFTSERDVHLQRPVDRRLTGFDQELITFRKVFATKPSSVRRQW